MDGKVEALEFNVLPDSKLTNIPLRDLKLKNNILIAGIIRGKKSINPSGNDTILPDDRVIIIAAEQKIRSLADIIK